MAAVTSVLGMKVEVGVLVEGAGVGCLGAGDASS